MDISRAASLTLACLGFFFGFSWLFFVPLGALGVLVVDLS